MLHNTTESVKHFFLFIFYLGLIRAEYIHRNENISLDDYFKQLKILWNKFLALMCGCGSWLNFNNTEQRDCTRPVELQKYIHTNRHPYVVDIV